MARERGPLGSGLGGGTLLDTLIVKIDVDMSGLQRGIAAAIAEIRSLKGAIASQVGGVSLSDAMNAALVAPVLVATARLGQMRNEVRALAGEIRAVAAIGGPGANAALPAAAAGLALGSAPVLDAQRAGPTGVTRLANGQWARAWDANLAGASVGLAALGGMNRQERAEVLAQIARDELSDSSVANEARGGPLIYGPQIPPAERRRRERAARTAARLGRGVSGAAAELGEQAGNAAGFGRGGFWSRQAESTGDAFNRGAARFPGIYDAIENIGGSGARIGQGVNRAMGSRLAHTLGLVGLGTLMGDLITLAASLATVIGAMLAGAFAALATPLGLVVVAITALVGLFVAAHWDDFKKFGEWFGDRAKVLLGEAANDIVEGWRHLSNAFDELWMTIRDSFGFGDDSALVVMQFFGELVLRVLNAVGEAVGGLLRIVAELVRAIAAAIRGDWAGAWQHAQNIVGQFVTGVKETFLSLLPELRQGWDSFFGWFSERAADAGRMIQRLFPNNERGARAPNLARDAMKGFRGRAKTAGGDDEIGDPDQKLPGAANDNKEARLERLGRLADDFGARISGAFEEAIAGGAKFSDILRGLIADLVMMVVRMAVIEPMARGIADAIRGATGSGSSSSSGGGGFWSSIGNFFAGFFADGGQIGPGKWGIVGERGPEIVFGGRSGATITPMGAGGMHIDARAFIDARGADPAAIQRLQAALARRDAELPARIRAHVTDMKQRGRLAA